MTDLAGQPAAHPSWCDPEHCTAPAVHPTRIEYKGGESSRQGQHRSAPLADDAVVFEADQVYLSQSASAPWKCDTYLNVESGSPQRRMMMRLGSDSSLVWAILAHLSDDARLYPLLYEDEAAKRGIIWRPLSTEDALPEPRTTNAKPAPLVDAPIVDERETTEIVDPYYSGDYVTMFGDDE